ncbi:MAG: GHMP kinase [Pseudomonadota bacterium]
MTDSPDAVAHAPGKLILSGEHSVLYGAPAMAMAIASYTEVWFKSVGPKTGLRTAFGGLSAGAYYPLKILSRFKHSLDQRFDQFKRGELGVRQILTRPDDLAVYTLAALLQDKDGGELTGVGAVNRVPLPGQLGSRSSLPIGAGLGSSAAVVAATTVLFESLLDRHKSLEARYERVRFCERLKHGNAGPIDAATVVRGGLVRYDGQGFSTHTLAHDHSLARGEGWFCALQGRPLSPTGECVSQVRERHGSDRVLWDRFAECTQALATALTNGVDPDEAIRENQRLLDVIGVVPAVTREFIAAVEAAGGAAKVCGAGAVRGDNGGAILVHLRDPEAITSLSAQYPAVQWSPLCLSRTGAAVGPAPQRPLPAPAG